MGKSAVVIGAGFSGLSSALYLAKNGFKVDILEKNILPGGRAYKYEDAGFTFDMGPSWYWMPDIFEDFFADFNYKPSDFYDLVRLDPAYRIFFGKDDYMDIPGHIEETYELFDSLEKNGAKKLKKFLNDAGVKYQIGMHNFVYKPGKSITEYFDLNLMGKILSHHSFQSVSKLTRGIFKNPRLIKVLEFPVLFLGATAQKTPSLYSLMNYADLVLGTWYPMGGFYKIIEAMIKIADELGVSIHTSTEVEAFEIVNSHIRSVSACKKSFFADQFIASADYHHIDNDILGEKNRNYSEKYWDKKSLAPSAILFYIGIDKPLDNLLHHNLFFDTDFDIHASQIYTDPKWPSDPAIYVSCASKTDKSIAPDGHENLVVLVPVAPNLQDNGKVRDHYYNLVIDKLEKITNQNIRDHILVHRSYAHTDFINDYNSYKGNAYGLSNKLLQTGILRPSITHKHIKNLRYAGQLTIPGPGVPPSLISGNVVANDILKTL